LALAKLSIEVPSTVQVEEPAKEQAQIDLFAELSFAADGVPGHEEQGYEEPFGRHAGSVGLAVGGGKRLSHAREDAIGPAFDVAQGGGRAGCDLRRRTHETRAIAGRLRRA
jgi:hypothetical protein